MTLRCYACGELGLLRRAAALQTHRATTVRSDCSILHAWSRAGLPGPRKTRSCRRGPPLRFQLRGQLDYAGDRYELQLDRLVVGDNVNPEVGFLRRDDFERSFGSFRFSPRPRSIALIRTLSWAGSLNYITNRAGELETRDLPGQFGIEFENGDQFNTGAGVLEGRPGASDRGHSDPGDLARHPPPERCSVSRARDARVSSRYRSLGDSRWCEEIVRRREPPVNRALDAPGGVRPVHELMM